MSFIPSNSISCVLYPTFCSYVLKMTYFKLPVTTNPLLYISTTFYRKRPFFFLPFTCELGLINAFPTILSNCYFHGNVISNCQLQKSSLIFLLIYLATYFEIVKNCLDILKTLHSFCEDFLTSTHSLLLFSLTSLSFNSSKYMSAQDLNVQTSHVPIQAHSR